MIDVGDWVCSRHSLPVFVNEECSLPGFIHTEKCTAGCTAEGFPSKRGCNCGAAVAVLPAKAPVQLRRITSDSVFVDQPESAPFWIERAPFRKTSAPVPEAERRAAPPDFLAIELALATETVRAGRRKRVPIGAEIVFVRADLRNGKVKPLRFLCEFTPPEGRCALLIDPSLPTDRALSSGWKEQFVVPLAIEGEPVGLERILVPAFPIGNVEDPGWK